MTFLDKYERKDYCVLAREFGCQLKIGKYGVKFINRDPAGRIYKIVQIIPLTGWYTDQKAVEHIMRERGLEL